MNPINATLRNEKYCDVFVEHFLGRVKQLSKEQQRIIYSLLQTKILLETR